MNVLIVGDCNLFATNDGAASGDIQSVLAEKFLCLFRHIDERPCGIGDILLALRRLSCSFKCRLSAWIELLLKQRPMSFCHVWMTADESPDTSSEPVDAGAGIVRFKIITGYPAEPLHDTFDAEVIQGRGALASHTDSSLEKSCAVKGRRCLSNGFQVAHKRISELSRSLLVLLHGRVECLKCSPRGDHESLTETSTAPRRAARQRASGKPPNRATFTSAQPHAAGNAFCYRQSSDHVQMSDRLAGQVDWRWLTCRSFVNVPFCGGMIGMAHPDGFHCPKERHERETPDTAHFEQFRVPDVAEFSDRGNTGRIQETSLPRSQSQRDDWNVRDLWRQHVKSISLFTEAAA